MRKEFHTSDMAREAGVHLNTVRFYERIGFISPVPRGANGYRCYGPKHLVQIRVLRCIYRYGWLGRGLRRKTLAITRALLKWKLAEAEARALEYRDALDEEVRKARETAGILERWAARKRPAARKRGGGSRAGADEAHGLVGKGLKHCEAARRLGVTEELLRNWERNGLLRVPRQGPNHARVYGPYELERMRIIYLLRQSGYSMAAILASLNAYDRRGGAGVIAALHEPADETWNQVGDRWLAALQEALAGACEMLEIIAVARAAKK
jgi:DNA-binding transcriptional MerR regulator